MSLSVPYISDKDIESEATQLLKSFEAKYGVVQTAAVPVEEIIENHLGLTFEIIDLGDSLMLGQLDIKKNLIRINSTLDPSGNPHLEGRYNFTLGHEIGHNTVHRPYAEALLGTASFFDNGENPDIILCREENQNQRIEVQADKFSSFFLMPKQKVIAEFMALTGKHSLPAEIFAESLRHTHDFMNPIWPNWKIAPSADEILGHAFDPLAVAFKVSRKAMVIRLKGLGLLQSADQASFELV